MPSVKRRGRNGLHFLGDCLRQVSPPLTPAQHSQAPFWEGGCLASLGAIQTSGWPSVAGVSVSLAVTSAVCPFSCIRMQCTHLEERGLPAAGRGLLLSRTCKRGFFFFLFLSVTITRRIIWAKQFGVGFWRRTSKEEHSEQGHWS